MSRTRNDSWKEDDGLKKDLEDKVKFVYKRKEILMVVKSKYPQYAWSLSSLRDRLAYFGIKYHNYDVHMDDVVEAVREEVNGPGGKMGYRAMWKRLRDNGIQVPRSYAYLGLQAVDPDGLASRGGVGQKKVQRNKRFVSDVSQHNFLDETSTVVSKVSQLAFNKSKK